MAELFSIDGLFSVSNFFTLLMLILLQAVLGFDNLLYISMESKRVEADQQQKVRRLGVGMAIGLRIVLLLVLLIAIDYFKEPFTHIDLLGVHAAVSVHSLIVLGGGGFIIYTAIKEIFHMLAGDLHAEESGGEKKSPGQAIFWIVIMNLVFSFDSILSAIALTHQFWVMAVAIIVSGIMMIVLSDAVSNFLQKNRMYEVLGLFILFLVGIMLVSEGGHLAHVKFGENEVHAMSKTTFYFVLGMLVIVDVVQGRYRKRLQAAQDARLQHVHEHDAAGA
jgi:predicted tellurium resistance membrane protein TerC